jgi:hypothetical protein
MTVSLSTITFDCADPATVAGFWSEALGRPVDPGTDDAVRSIGLDDPAVTPSLVFLRVPEPKRVKNRVHLDVVTDDREKEVHRLVGLGATRVDDKDEGGYRWTVMTDPEANEFCVAASEAPG